MAANVFNFMLLAGEAAIVVLLSLALWAKIRRIANVYYGRQW